MWVFCKYGFFSAVENRDSKSEILLRARFEGDLERLSEAYGLGLNVRKTPKADYLYRADITKSKWSEVAASIAQEIDYPNFKGSLPHTADNSIRNDAYLRCWLDLCEAQDAQAAGGKDRGFGLASDETF